MKKIASKTLLVAMTIMSVAVAPFAHAAPTKKVPTTAIKFAKGSYCGVFSNTIRHKHNFTLHLTKGQALTVITQGGYFDGIEVRDPKKILLFDFATPEDSAETYYAYHVKNTGIHKVTITTGGNEWRDIQFCAD